MSSSPTSAEAAAFEPAWETFLRSEAMGWLLPSACRQAMSPHLAARFLRRLTGRPDQLELLHESSLISAHLNEIIDFVRRALPAWVRIMPSVSERLREVHEGVVPGPLDIPATLALRRRGQHTRFVTRRPIRRFDRPENILVAAVARRLLAILVRLRSEGVIRQKNWGAEALACEGVLRHVFRQSTLRQVPEVPITAVHLQGAIEAPMPIYEQARALWAPLSAITAPTRPDAVARLVAEGALAPLEPHRRFEYAVCVALIAGLWRTLDEAEPHRWRLERSLVIEGRDEIAALVRPADGARLRVYYDTTAQLPAGPRDLGVQRYLGVSGRLRPDITVWCEIPGQKPRAVVVEVKLSVDREYLASGFQEALAYVNEYRPVLWGWPKAILVTSAAIPGAPARDDDAVAIDWDRWPSADLLHGITEGVSHDTSEG
ncbi:MAG: hypothetical protein ACE366_02635 [Bradymonadia bacterium]